MTAPSAVHLHRRKREWKSRTEKNISGKIHWRARCVKKREPQKEGAEWDLTFICGCKFACLRGAIRGDHLRDWPNLLKATLYQCLLNRIHNYSPYLWPNDHGMCAASARNTPPNR